MLQSVNTILSQVSMPQFTATFRNLSFPPDMAACGTCVLVMLCHLNTAFSVCLICMPMITEYIIAFLGGGGGKVVVLHLQKIETECMLSGIIELLRSTTTNFKWEVQAFWSKDLHQWNYKNHWVSMVFAILLMIFGLKCLDLSLEVHCCATYKSSIIPDSHSSP